MEHVAGKSSLPTYTTRNHKDIQIPMAKPESTKKGFQYAGSKAWNNIPITIRELSSLSLLKYFLKKHSMSYEKQFMPSSINDSL